MLENYVSNLCYGSKIAEVMRKEKTWKHNVDTTLVKFFCLFVGAVALILIFDVGCTLQSLGKPERKLGTPVETTVEEKPPESQNSPEKPRIGYLRLHGLPINGEDIVRIFYKLAYCIDLTAVLPNATDVFTIGYPDHFKASLTDDFYGNTGGFDLIALHARWNHEEYRKLLGEKALFFTMMRNPVDAFVEVFYERPDVLDSFYGGPLSVVMAKIKLGNISRDARFAGIYGRNQMAWNFGMDSKDFDNPKKVDKLIKHIDETFHLVMMYEKYNESVALLQRVLGLDTRLMAMNARKIVSPPWRKGLSSEERTVLEEWLDVDMKIYNHFKRKFEKLVAEVGEEEMTRLQKQLEKQNAHNYETCYDPNNLRVATEADAFTGVEMDWAMPFRDVSYCRVHGLTEQSMHQDLIFIQMNKDFRNIYKDPSVIYSHFHDEGL